MLEALLKKLYGDATGPLGFPMGSAQAKALDVAMKELNSDVRSAFKCVVGDHEVEGYCRKAEVVDVTTVEDERSDKSLIMTESVDRDREIVLADGCNFKTFKTNPVVTYMHSYYDLPVGKSIWQQRERSDKPNKNGWMAKTVYHKRPKEWSADVPYMAEAVWSLIQDGNMRGKSIGFMPISMRAPTEKEIVARPELAKIGYVIDKCMIVEYAVGAIPVNPDALVQSIGKMRQKSVMGVDRLLELMGVEIGEDGSYEETDEEATPPPAKKNKSGIRVTRRWTELEVISDVRQAAKMARAARHGKVYNA